MPKPPQALALSLKLTIVLSIVCDSGEAGVEGGENDELVEVSVLDGFAAGLVLAHVQLGLVGDVHVLTTQVVLLQTHLDLLLPAQHIVPRGELS